MAALDRENVNLPVLELVAFKAWSIMMVSSCSCSLGDVNCGIPVSMESEYTIVFPIVKEQVS